MIDESTYGLNKQDAEQVIGMIGMSDVEFEEMKPTGKGGGLQIRISGNQIQTSQNGTTWTTIGQLGLRLNGGQYQYALDAHEASPTWTNWLGTTSTCPP